MSEKYLEDGVEVDCPDCGSSLMCGHLVIRENTHTGHKFLGCSNYPVCRYTDEYDDPNDTVTFDNDIYRAYERRDLDYFDNPPWED